MSRVVVTGAGGYIGSQLVKFLLQQGFEVVAIDRFFFGLDVFSDISTNSNLIIVRADCRNLNETYFENVQAVFDLVSLSNDPAGDLNPELTHQINFLSRVRTAQISQKFEVKKYILMSSCSVYGAGRHLSLNEDSEVRPLTVYAKAALAAENEILPMSTPDFSVSVMRNATAFGLSSRMRFDLVVNLMTLNAFERNEIVIRGGGNQTRPVIHVDDICVAAKSIYDADNDVAGGQIFNIGMSNFKISQIAYLIRDFLDKDIKVVYTDDDIDNRSYNVSFGKATRLLNFSASRNIEFGVNQIYRALVNGLTEKNDKTSTVNWYRRILESERLFNELNLEGKIF